MGDEDRLNAAAVFLVESVYQPGRMHYKITCRLTKNTSQQTSPLIKTPLKPIPQSHTTPIPLSFSQSLEVWEATWCPGVPLQKFPIRSVLRLGIEILWVSIFVVHAILFTTFFGGFFWLHSLCMVYVYLHVAKYLKKMYTYIYTGNIGNHISYIDPMG